MSIFRYAAAALCLLAGAAAADGTITVQGTGSVAAPPDMATIHLSVTREAEAAAQAVAAMSEAAAAVLSGLADAGIAEADIQSSALRLHPVYRDTSRSGADRPEIRGYIASTDVTVRVRDLAQLGPTLDSAVDVGANGFDGLSFGLQAPQAAEDAARRAAVGEAARKAALYADAAGVALGPLVSLNEAQTGGGPIMMEARAMSDGSAIAPGEVTVEATVTMVWDLGD